MSFLGSLKLKLEDLDMAAILSTVIVRIKDNPINNLQVPGHKTKGNFVAEYASSLLAMKDDDDLTQAFTCTMQNVFEVLKDVNVSQASSRENMWREIHQLVSQPNVGWNAVIEKLQTDNKSPIFTTLYKNIVFDIVGEILSLNNVGKEPSNEDTPVSLTEKEKMAIHYVAGYVVFALEKHYARLKQSIVTQAALTFFKSCYMFNVDDSLNVSSFQQWTDKLNRGGLKMVTDDVYKLFRRIEKAVQLILNKELITNYRNEDIREILEKRIQNDVFVLSGWDTSARHIPNAKLAALFKRQIICKWVDIRARSSVKSYIQILRQKLREEKNNKIAPGKGPSKSAEPSLRKTLS